MLNEIRTEDELAGVIGHELAHRTMGKQKGNIEVKADTLGFEYIVKAGYDKCKAAQFLLSADETGRFAATGCTEQ